MDLYRLYCLNQLANETVSCVVLDGIGKQA